MKRIRIKILLQLIIFTNVLLSQSAVVNIPITVSDLSGGHSKIVYFGLDPRATDGLDATLGEVDMPPLPPVNAFDVRFNLPSSEATMKDYRYGTSTFEGQKNHEIQYQVGSGGSKINLSWELPLGVTGIIKDVVLGSLINVHMSGIGNYTIDNPSVFNKLNIELDYSLLKTIPPYFQNFDDISPLSLPIGWKIVNSNEDDRLWTNTSSNPYSEPNSMQINSNHLMDMDDWFFSPGLNLVQGVDYEVLFWYKVGDPLFSEKLEVKYGMGQDVASMTSNSIFTKTGITNSDYIKGQGIITPSSSGIYYIGWHGFSDQNNSSIYVDDILIRNRPSITNNQIITAGNTALIQFPGTGVFIKFSLANLELLNITIDKILYPPGGTLPENLSNFARQYWTITTNEGLVTGTYSITLDLTGILGIEDCTTLHLIKRENPNSGWFDMGVPSDCNTFPLLTWSGLTSFSEFGIGGSGSNLLPIELRNFSAKILDKIVLLEWSTSTEINNYGFEIEKKNKDDNWKTIGFVAGTGNSNVINEYSFIDVETNFDNCLYRLKQIDIDGKITYSKEIEVNFSHSFSIYKLQQNYPNPFNPSTNINFTLPNQAFVTLKIYDILGKEVTTLINEELNAGNYTKTWDSKNLSSGVYFYKLTAGKFTETKKMVLVR